MLKRFIIYSLIAITTWIFLSQCLIMRNRWSDEKANRIFINKNVPIEIHDTIIDGTHLHYAITGADTLPTLVFIHGSPGSWMNYATYMWDSALLKKFRMVAIDRPGFGYSDFGKALPLQKQRDIILPVLKSLKTGKPMYLFGHSMGGPVVISLAAKTPEQFKGIVLAAASLDVEQEKKETWRKIMNHKPFYWALPGAFGPSNTELLHLKKDLIPLQKDFEKITCDVYFIHGDKDTWVPMENVAYGRSMLSNANVILIDTIAAADHQIPWKNKDRVTGLLLKLYD